MRVARLCRCDGLDPNREVEALVELGGCVLIDTAPRSLEQSRENIVRQHLHVVVRQDHQHDDIATFLRTEGVEDMSLRLERSLLQLDPERLVYFGRFFEASREILVKEWVHVEAVGALRRRRIRPGGQAVSAERRSGSIVQSQTSFYLLDLTSNSAGGVIAVVVPFLIGVGRCKLTALLLYTTNRLPSSAS